MNLRHLRGGSVRCLVGELDLSFFCLPPVELWVAKEAV